MNNFRKYMQAPANWLSVSAHGNPPEGLYLALYRPVECNNLVIELLSYYPDDIDSQLAGAGWMGDSEDGNYDCQSRDVVAYLPDNLDMRSLGSVREHFRV